MGEEEEGGKGEEKKGRRRRRNRFGQENAYKEPKFSILAVI